MDFSRLTANRSGVICEAGQINQYSVPGFSAACAGAGNVTAFPVTFRKIVPMKTIVLAALAASFLTMPAYAKKFELPTANPAITVDLPDAWQPEESDQGAFAQSEDNNTYVAVETGTSKTLDQLIKDDFAWLTKTSGVTIDVSTQTSKDSTVNGMPVSLMQWKAKDKDGPMAVSIWIYGITENLIALVTTTNRPDADKANAAVLAKILAGIKKQ